jgi:hypothetical protein
MNQVLNLSLYNSILRLPPSFGSTSPSSRVAIVRTSFAASNMLVVLRCPLPSFSVGLSVQKIRCRHSLLLFLLPPSRDYLLCWPRRPNHRILNSNYWLLSSAEASSWLPLWVSSSLLDRFSTDESPLPLGSTLKGLVAKYGPESINQSHCYRRVR